MKILLIAPLPPPNGGMQTWTNLYLASSYSQNNTVKLINTSLTGKRIKNLTKICIFEELYRATRIFIDLFRTTRQDKYDVVHLNNSCSTFGMCRDYICLKLIGKNKPIILIHYHCDTSTMVNSKIGTYIFRRLTGQGKCILCLNKSSEEHIKRTTQTVPLVIPNFINAYDYVADGDRANNNEVMNIIYIGHIKQTKGCSEFISTAAYFPTIKFTLIGLLSEGYCLGAIPENVEYIGEIDKEQVHKHMIDADIMVFPSYTEGFPLVVLEAMACGLPIVATPVGAIPEMVEHEGGVLVNVGSVEEIVKAINYLKDVKIRDAMSSWSKRKVLLSYTSDIVMKQIYSIYSTRME